MINFKNATKGYLLVSMEGIPYWADTVEQIPFVIDTYKMFYRQYGNKQKARNGVIKLGNIFADGTILNLDYSNSYDSAMILRRLQYRTHSSDLSNNEPTIDIHNKLDNRKIHIDIHQNKGMK